MQITFWNLQKRVPLKTGKIKKLIRKVLQGERVKKTGWINLCFVDNLQIKKFNAKYHHTKSPTDVLAFDSSDKKEKGVLRADIMISTQVALKQAADFKTTVDYEISLYVVHGILHILGYDDRSRLQTKLMRKKESQYVN
ncbi:MAG TPA: rRNA maturation RNase YbeY [Candidatus Omnitrophota bacterium]|nr:rRNA maturation RNase YbeY [Candidatus Omnitrophota bacterium]HPT38864.1 rRNA maturation RNase YbeY [Candidatus Omnitrophota bacterium]